MPTKICPVQPWRSEQAATRHALKTIIELAKAALDDPRFLVPKSPKDVAPPVVNVQSIILKACTAAGANGVIYGDLFALLQVKGRGLSSLDRNLKSMIKNGYIAVGRDKRYRRAGVEEAVGYTVANCANLRHCWRYEVLGDQPCSDCGGEHRGKRPGGRPRAATR